MKKKQFYRFIPNEQGGILFAPKGTDTLFGLEVKPIEDWENAVFMLKYGYYLPFMDSNVSAQFANEELKNTIQEIIPADYPLEFYPIQVKSEKYGDETYYLIHFKTIFDTIDKKNSIWAGNSITKPHVDYDKAKDLDFFNSSYAINSIIISDKMKRLMQQRKLDAGIDFVKVPYE